MATVLEDVTNESLDARYLQYRVNDWEKRVNELYHMIMSWLPEGWTACKGKSVVMHEPLMCEFDIDARLIPTLDLTSETGDHAKFEPRGLWMIGTNGRVDLKRTGHHYLIVDFAENFNQSDWRVTPAQDRWNRVTLTRDWLKQALR